ncbi:FAD-dependent oxidoreductase [Gammaproteobacteria bacterium AS21]
MMNDAQNNSSHAGLNVAVLGAGVVGLSSAISLQQAGFKVTLIDTQQPGLGTSFGNAGLFADYARLPFANFATLKKIPKMLLDKNSPLAISPSYTPNLLTYAKAYIKSCKASHYNAAKQGLYHLHSIAKEADKALISASKSEHLISQQGFLGLFSTSASFELAKPSFIEREQQGAKLELLSSEQIRTLEPQLKMPFHGAVYYPNTYHSLDPQLYSESLFIYFKKHGGVFRQEKITQINPIDHNNVIELRSVLHSTQYDQLVIATGAATKALVEQLHLSIPQVCERGYHLMLKDSALTLNRPIAWMNQGVHMTPMNKAIRVAGTAEYAEDSAPPSERRKAVMLNHAKQMLGLDIAVDSSWVGSRATTPDSLPIIAKMQKQPNVTLAFGHGHLGLTFAATTGRIVAQLVANKTPEIDISAFSAERFS